MQWGTLKTQKALEVLLYILSKGCTNMYNVLKVVYFADKKHLKKTGHTISKDRYIAMKSGPVPSGAYDLIKAVRAPVQSSMYNDYPELVKGSMAIDERDPYTLIPLRRPDLRMFSPADYSSLDEAISEYGQMPFSELKQKSHEELDYQKADQNDTMSFDYFVQSVDEDGNIRAFLQDCLEEAPC
jgi:uncharacterized phage-associated protein